MSKLGATQNARSDSNLRLHISQTITTCPGLAQDVLFEQRRDILAVRNWLGQTRAVRLRDAHSSALYNSYSRRMEEGVYNQPVADVSCGRCERESYGQSS